MNTTLLQALNQIVTEYGSQSLADPRRVKALLEAALFGTGESGAGAAPSGGMACPSCGRALPDVARFCLFCGTATASGAARTAGQGKEIWRELYTLAWHTGSVWSVAYSPDGCRIASGSDDETIKIWGIE